MSIHPRLSSCSMLGAVALMALPQAGLAATFAVPADFPTIQGAIDASVDGDWVEVAAGTYLEAIDFTGKNIQVVGAGPAVTTIDAQQSTGIVARLVGVSADALLEGFTIRGGSTTTTSVGARVRACWSMATSRSKTA